MNRGKSRGGRGGSSRGRGKTFGIGNKSLDKKKRFRGDEELRSDDENDEDNTRGRSEDATFLDDGESTLKKRKGETPEEARLRLAKGYLEKMNSNMIDKGLSLDSKEDEDVNAFDALDLDRDIIATRLRQDVSDSKRTTRRLIADKMIDFVRTDDNTTIFRGHQRSVTAAIISQDEKTAYSASKDCNIIKWDLINKKKLHKYKGESTKDVETFAKGHNGVILGLALSSDGSVLASCGTDKGFPIRLFNNTYNKHMENLVGHRDIVTCVAFKKDSLQLYSGSYDRTVKIWNIKNRSYIDTLFGHQDKVISIDSLYKDNPVSVGESRSVHLWKVEKETQLIFHGHTGSVDAISMMDETTFVTGSQDGSIAVWFAAKKRPACVIPRAHGFGLPWISALAAVPFTDLFASGSCDGFVRFWKVILNQSGASVKQISQIPVEGWINSLMFTDSGSKIIIGVGKDHRLGRWEVIDQAVNSTVIIDLPIKI